MVLDTEQPRFKHGAIKVTRQTRCNGETLHEGKTYRVPEDVPAKDARYLVNIKKAVPAEAPASKAAEARRTEKQTKGKG